MLEALKKTCITSHDVASLALDSIRHFPYALRRPRLLFRQLYEVGNRSLLIVSVMGLFIGMVLALHLGYMSARYRQEHYIGLIGLAIVKEFGPVITAFLLAGRIGSAYAAEIGTMKVYEEVDALVVMGVRPVAYLASPRLIACLVMLPLLVIYADFIGLLGGTLVAQTYLGVSPEQFFKVFFQATDMADVWRSLCKSTAFGGIIAVTGCYFGFKTTGGAEGVGRSTTDSVVYALLAVLIADYFIEKVLLAL
jgi:phospholipid/cholesterol/gamma-HCH transport system permease protein